MPALTFLLLAASIDGTAALRHASALSALGPHPWGSPRTAAAALYVAAQFRDAGLEEVRIVDLEEGGLRGSNVLGILRSGGSGTVVLTAHHDTTPGSPGGWDPGGSLGVLIESARALARNPKRSRDIVFVSFDGGAVGLDGRSVSAGAHAWASSLGREANSVVGIVSIEGAGWPSGRPIVHALTYQAESVGGGRVTAPGALVASVLGGMRRGGVDVALGDPLAPWLYQPTSRLLQLDFGGADRPLLQAGLPSVLLTETSVAKPYPWIGQPLDTPDRLDAPSLERMGRAVLGAVEGMKEVSRTGSTSMEWFFGLGRILEPSVLAVAGAVSLLPVLFAGLRAGGMALGLRLVHSAVFAVVVLRMPVLGFFLLGVPNLAALFGGLRWRLLGLLPTGLCLTFGALAARQGLVHGLLPGLLDLTLLLLGLAFALVPAASRPAKRRAPSRAQGKAKRKGLPKR